MAEEGFRVQERRRALVCSMRMVARVSCVSEPVSGVLMLAICVATSRLVFGTRDRIWLFLIPRLEVCVFYKTPFPLYHRGYRFPTYG